MGAVKAMAIELEAGQEEASQVSSTTTAYRLGMLQACRLITQQGNRYVSSSDNSWQALHETWRTVFDAVEYLREVENQERAA